MSEEDISWESDRKTRFKQPPGFVSKECASTVSCSDCLGDQYDDCGDHVDPVSGTEYKYWYPDNAKVGSWVIDRVALSCEKQGNRPQQGLKRPSLSKGVLLIAPSIFESRFFFFFLETAVCVQSDARIFFSFFSCLCATRASSLCEPVGKRDWREACGQRTRTRQESGWRLG